mgnify:FL=1
MYQDKKTVGGYPSPFADPQVKESKEYIHAYLKRMYHDYKNEDYSLYDYQKLAFAENRKYADGNQSVAKYKDLMETQGDSSYMNLDWSPVSIIPKFVDVVVGGLINQEYEIICNAVDPFSVEKKRRERATLQANVKMRDMFQQVEQSTGINLSEQRNIMESDDEVDLYMDLTYKQSAEIAMEQAVELVFNINNFENIKERACRDIVVLGIAATKVSTGPNNKIEIDYVDPQRLVTSYSSSPDFKDINHAGEVRRISIRDLKRLAGNQFTEEEYADIAKLVKGKYGNDSLGLTSDKVDDYYGKPYDSFDVEILDGEFLTVDEYRFEKKSNKYGTKTFHEKPFDYKPPKNSKYKREQKNINVKAVYKGKYIIGTDYVFDYGRAENMVREKSNLSETQLSYCIIAPNMRNMRIKSIVERMIPFADQIQLTHLKLQQLIAKARPKGLAIEIGGLENVTKGDGGAVWDPLELQSVYDQTGNFYYRSIDDDGTTRHGPPITELENGIGRDLQSLIAIYNYNLERIRDVTGINEARDASQPSTEALVGVQKLALLASNNATRQMNNGLLHIMEKCASVSVLRLQDVLTTKDGFKAYQAALGDSALTSIKDMKEISHTDYGINIQALPDEEEKQYLEQNIQASLQQKELRVEDAIMVRSIKNIKLANRMLMLRRKEYMKDMAQKAKETAQANAEQQSRAAQTAAQAKAQEIQIKSQGEMESLKMEYQLRDQFEQRQHERKMKEIELQETIRGRFDKQEEQERTERKNVTAQ